MEQLRNEYRKILRMPEVKRDIKKMSFFEKVCLEDLHNILNEYYKGISEEEEAILKRKLIVLIDSYGGIEKINEKLKNYGINLEASIIASGIF